MPAFLLCLLFTNLQPRFMILIYQQGSNAGIREIICKFNLLHYGSLLMIYPILIFTNLNWVLFVGMSMIYFPQIYQNGVNGIRPDISSHYYTSYLLARLIIIVIILLFRPIFDASPIIYSNSSLTIFYLQLASLSLPFKYFILYPVWPSVCTKKIRL